VRRGGVADDPGEHAEAEEKKAGEVMDAQKLLSLCDRLESDWSDTYQTGDSAGDDARLLAAWVREQVRPDDGEPATHEWLDSIGRDPDTCAIPWKNCYGWRLCVFGQNDPRFDSNPHFEYPTSRREWEDGPDIPNCRTRGSVRLLCRALGIDLKEASA
jgi:hypothetical protein